MLSNNQIILNRKNSNINGFDENIKHDIDNNVDFNSSNHVRGPDGKILIDNVRVYDSGSNSDD